MYGLLALGFHVTWAVSRTVNFANGSSMLRGAAVLALVTRYTVYGKALLAVVQNPQAARLVGVRVETATSAAYVLSTIFAGVAGVLIAPLVTVSAGMGWVFGIKAFATAILGGLDSAWGVVVAGILFGVTEALITAVLGSTYTNILSFGVVIPALALMPHRLLGRAGAQRV